MSQSRFLNKIALITGASRGIGRAVAHSLAKEGAQLILVARRKEGLERVDDELKKIANDNPNPHQALLVPLDLADGQAIDRLGGAIFDRWGKLDILVGNAGILGPLSPLAHIDPLLWDKTLAINLTANWRLIRAMELLLRQADDARCAFITSSSPRSLRPFWGAYATSKAGLEVFIQIWAKECAQTSIKINLFEPGKARTAMRAEAMPGEDPQSLPKPEDIIAPLLNMLTKDFQHNGTLVRP